MNPSEIRTSLTHPIRVDWLDAPARVGMTFLPGMRADSSHGYRWERDLDADLEGLRRAGATALVCLLDGERELEHYRTGDLIGRARSHGLEVLRLPIPDRGVPRSLEQVDELLDAMAALEAAGGRLVIHCRGGLGRTGTIAGCYLVRSGRSPTETLEILRRVRTSDRCPENDLQRSFIRRYAEHVGRRPATAAVAIERPPDGSRKHEEPAAWYATSRTGFASAESAATRTRTRSRIDAVVELLGQVERDVAAAPETSFELTETGEATLTAAGRSFAAGRFLTPTLAELRSRAAARPRGTGGRLTLSVLHGAHGLTDIGTLQATAPARTLFQVASQFNCLEAPGPHIVPVRRYLADPTQGPRASISAFPGTFLRHYCAPSADGTRFVQTDSRCINLLGDAFDPSVAEVRSGYLQPSGVHDWAALADALEHSFDQLRVGVHDDIEVVFGHDWIGPVPRSRQRIAQVFTSTIALGGYGHDDGSAALVIARRQLLRAAYLGTLLAALGLDSDTVVLTMIGGGVFGNPHRDIWDAIHWALAQADPLVNGTKQVLVNTREPLAEPDLAEVRSRGGVVVRFSKERIDVLD